MQRYQFTLWPGFVSSSDMFCSHFRQQPRYVAAKKNTQVHFICHSRNSASVQWYKMTERDKTPQVIDVTGPRVSEERSTTYVTIILSKIQAEDNGIYLCENKSLARDLGRIRTCGSELRVIGEMYYLCLCLTPDTLRYLSIYRSIRPHTHPSIPYRPI